MSVANGSTLHLIQEEQAARIQRCFQDLQLQACCSEAVNAVAAAAQALSLKVQELLVQNKFSKATDPCFYFYLLSYSHTLWKYYGSIL